jgi:hypothetical protein
MPKRHINDRGKIFRDPGSLWDPTRIYSKYNNELFILRNKKIKAVSRKMKMFASSSIEHNSSQNKKNTKTRRYAGKM